MSTDLQSEANSRSAGQGGPKILALICAYLVLAVAVGVTRGALQDAGGARAPSMSVGAPHHGLMAR
jgi:hypothetical protein